MEIHATSGLIWEMRNIMRGINDIADVFDGGITMAEFRWFVSSSILCYLILRSESGCLRWALLLASARNVRSSREKSGFLSQAKVLKLHG